MKVFYFIQGWTRYYMYYGKYRISRKFLLKKEYPKIFYIYQKWNNFVHNLLPSHIRQQIEIRIKSSLDCILASVCKICKCDTPALQMANKACDKPCYPAMMNKKDWVKFKTNLFNSLGVAPIIYHYDKATNKYWTIFENKFITREDFENKDIGKVIEKEIFTEEEKKEIFKNKINWNE